MADFLEVMRKYKRMCNSFNSCLDGCPLAKHNEECTWDDCLIFAFDHPYEVQATVEKWTMENPEPKYPSRKEWWASLYPDRHLYDPPCWYHIIPYALIKDVCDTNCNECMDRPIIENIAKKLGIKPLEVHDDARNSV